MAPRLGLTVDHDAVNSVTRGLVGDSSFAVLPDVPPAACFFLTLAFQIVSYQNRHVCHRSRVVALPRPTVDQTYMGKLRRGRDALWLCFFPIRLACPRKSHPDCHHPVQLDSTERSSFLRCLPASGGGWLCFPFPFVVHGGRVSREDGLYHLLARNVSYRFRPTCPSVGYP